MPETVLIVDDEQLTRRTLSALLEGVGLKVIAVGSAGEAAAELNRREFDLILLDILLPDENGLDLCRRIRARSQTPIVMLSTKSQLGDRINGLETGADDYIVKPFEPREVVARVRAHLRRARDLSRPDLRERIAIGDLVVDAAIQDVLVDGLPAGLTQKEFRLVRMLASNAGRAISRDSLHEHLWSGDDLPSDKILAVYVRRLRQKIEKDPGKPRYLRTLRGFGYKLAEPDADE